MWFRAVTVQNWRNTASKKTGKNLFTNREAKTLNNSNFMVIANTI